MGKKISFDIFDKKSIDNAIKQLQDYSDGLQAKCEMFCDRLATLGYTIATEKLQGVSGMYGTHHMEDYVFFRISQQPYKGGCQTLLVGIEKTFVSTWVSNGQKYSALICPLEMLEFGTGALAMSQAHAWEHFDVHSGNGTLSIAGHEGDKNWGANGNWSAITPTMPLYSAYVAMFKDFDRVAKEIFRQ